MYRFHIFKCEDGGYGFLSSFFFFFAKKLTFQGLYNCKLKNEMTLILEFFPPKKKKNTKLARRALASLVQSFSLTKFSSPG